MKILIGLLLGIGLVGIYASDIPSEESIASKDWEKSAVQKRLRGSSVSSQSTLDPFVSIVPTKRKPESSTSSADYQAKRPSVEPVATDSSSSSSSSASTSISARSALPISYPASKQELSSAKGHDISKELVKRIKDASGTISIATHSFTDRDVYMALKGALERKIKVSIVADRAHQDPKHEIFLHNLTTHGADVRYGASEDSEPSTPNNFVIFERLKKTKKPLLWTGSYDFTPRGVITKEDHVILNESQKTINRYRQQFKRLQMEAQE